MADQGQPLGPSRVIMSAAQLEDFAWLLGRYLTAENVRFVAAQVLGAGALSDSGNSEQLAKIAVQALSGQDRIADAIALLRQESQGSSKLMLGLNYIMNNKRLN